MESETNAINFLGDGAKRDYNSIDMTSEGSGSSPMAAVSSTGSLLLLPSTIDKTHQLGTAHGGGSFPSALSVEPLPPPSPSPPPTSIILTRTANEDESAPADEDNDDDDEGNAGLVPNRPYHTGDSPGRHQRNLKRKRQLYAERHRFNSAPMPVCARSAFKVALLVLLAGCAVAIGVAIGYKAFGASGGSQPAPNTLYKGVILISLDGFRADYLDRGYSPTLARLAAAGIRTQSLTPCFPSKTFPNHFSAVTGLLPDYHGIVDNTFYDPDLNDTFSISSTAANRDAKWWLAEPIWITALKQGVTTACWFWPGSEVPFEGNLRASYSTPYQDNMTNADRIQGVLQWLDLPIQRRPSFVTLYLSTVDNMGHSYGPDSAEVNNAIVEVDAALAQLLDGLQARSLDSGMDVVVISDHGMTQMSEQRIIVLDNYMDVSKVTVMTTGPHAGVFPLKASDTDAIMANLTGAHPNLHPFLRSTIPERYLYGFTKRVPPIFVSADVGWHVTTAQELGKYGGKILMGNHGFDNQAKDMGALFVAAGPSFAKNAGRVIESASILDVYPLLNTLLQVSSSPNNGTMKLAAYVG